jgi:hypothetical protein
MRLDDARKAWEAGSEAEGALAQLDRGGRSASAWRAAMRALLAAPENYREQAVTRDALVEVLESPGAPAERRVGAALALAGADDPETRTRIRVAAGACADERLRIALELAASDGLDDDGIGRVLDGPGASEPVTRRAQP